MKGRNRGGERPKIARPLLLRAGLFVAVGLGGGFLTSGAKPVWAQRADLTEIGIEKLLDLDVTTVSKKEQNLFQAASAIFVITADDIRRSGARSIPDLLRMVPGADVSQINAHVWAVTIRGFNDRYSKKLLVLIDGRTVYAPTNSGVYWDQQDVPLEDIERIEVIRGPGGTVWGANAMNGVINIITKNAKSTLGSLLSAAGGSDGSAEGLVQYGGVLRQAGAYRLFGKFRNFGSSSLGPGSAAADAWHVSHLGFRSDWDLSSRDTLTVQGDLLKTNAEQTITNLFLNSVPLQLKTFQDKTSVAAGDILGQWNRAVSNGSSTSLQFYYDRRARIDQGLTERLNTIDLDFHHHVTLGPRNDVVWGLGYRLSRSAYTPGYSFTFFPPRQSSSLFSAFFQDQVRLWKSLWLTLGSKFEHNEFTGFEYEPSAQLAWILTDQQALWFSASRAIRQPSRFDTGAEITAAAFPLPNGILGVLTVLGNPQIEPEQLYDYEIGYRKQVSDRLSLDMTGFSSFHRQMGTLEPGAPSLVANAAVPYVRLPLVFDTKASARSYGAEIFAHWDVTRRWRISPGFDLIRIDVRLDPTSRDATTEELEEETPPHRFRIRSSLRLPHNLEWDASWYYVDPLPDGDVPRYSRLDTRLAWRVAESVELSVVGQNLLRPRHMEFAHGHEYQITQPRRSAYGQITWRF